MTRFYDWSSMNRTSDWPWWAVLLVNKNWSQQAQNLGFIWIMPNDETNPEIFACSAHVLNGPKPVELSRCVVFGILSDRITFFSSPCAGRLKHLWRQPGFPKNKANWYTLQTSNPSEILATRVTKQATLTWDVGQQWLVNLQKYWPKISCTICFPAQKGEIIHIHWCRISSDNSIPRGHHHPPAGRCLLQYSIWGGQPIHLQKESLGCQWFTTRSKTSSMQAQLNLQGGPISPGQNLGRC